MPRVRLTRREVVAFGLFVLLGRRVPVLRAAQAGRRSARRVHRIERGDSWWIAIGVCSRCSRSPATWCCSARCSCADRGRIGWRESYQITMAGLAATRLFAAAGAGGIALTAWALRRSGMEPRLVACRMVAFMVLLYVDLRGLAADRRRRARRPGLFPGGGSFAITIVPAIVAAVLCRAGRRDGAAAGRLRAAPAALGVRARAALRTGWRARVTVPALAASGVRTAIDLIRSRDPGLLGARGLVGL